MRTLAYFGGQAGFTKILRVSKTSAWYAVEVESNFSEAMNQIKLAAYTIFIMTVAICICVALSKWFLPLGGILLILQLGCAIAALTTSRAGGVAAGVIGALSFNYLFTAPLFTFQIDKVEDTINFVVFMLVALLTSELAVYVRKQQRALEVANTQTTILRSVSHDLRTPLSAIIGSVETLLTYQNKLNDSERQALQQGVHSEAKRLYVYIENLLQATKIEHDALTINLAKTSLVTFLQKLEARVNNSRLVIKNLSSHQIVTLSESLFEQALYNVIDNALKFSERTVTLRVSNIGDNIQFQVFDEGVGFSDAKLDAPFALFKSTRQRDSGKGGIGLGLSVSKGIVDAHKGIITVSNEKVGCCVTLVIPY